MATARKLALSQLEEVHDTAVRLLGAWDADDAHRRDVVWRTGDSGLGPPRPPTIKVAPLAVAGLLRERLFGQTTTVLTSATLTLGGNFDSMARSWGLPAEQGPSDAGGGRGHREVASRVRSGPRWTSGRRSTTPAAASCTWPNTCRRRAATGCHRPIWTRSRS